MLIKNTEIGIARAYHAGAWIFLQSKNVFDEKRAAWLKSVHQQYYAAGGIIQCIFVCRVQCENCSVVCF